jgi:hypothetical protein
MKYANPGAGARTMPVHPARPGFLLGGAAALSLLGAIFCSPLGAQSMDEQAAYVALIYTPVGGLTPLAPRDQITAPRGRSGLTWQGRVGRFTREGGLSATLLAVGAELPRGRWRLGGTVAFASVSCGPDWAGDTDCAGDIMFGGSARTTLVDKPLDQSGSGSRKNASNGNTLLVGFDASLGFSPRSGEQALSLAGAVPVGISIEGRDTRIVPFLSPGLGYGRLGNVEYWDDDAPTSHGTFVLMMGGGVGFEFKRSGIGATLGFQKVLKSDRGATALGLGMTWQGPGSR